MNPYVTVAFDHPDGGTPIEMPLTPEGGSFAVGRSSESDLVLTPDEVSRCAVTITATKDGQVRITGGQRYGFVQVTREDGVRKATLAVGEEVLCGAGAYSVLIRTSVADVLSLVVRVPATRRNDTPGQQTVGMWSHAQIFNPYPDDDLRWLAALAAVVAQTPARSKADALMMVAKAWHDGDWSASLQKRFDKIRDLLNLPDSGGNKQDEIATWVHTTGVIPPEVFAEFTETVRRSAGRNLSRAELGTLGWARYHQENQ